MSRTGPLLQCLGAAFKRYIRGIPLLAQAEVNILASFSAGIHMVRRLWGIRRSFVLHRVPLRRILLLWYSPQVSYLRQYAKRASYCFRTGAADVHKIPVHYRSSKTCWHAGRSGCALWKKACGGLTKRPCAARFCIFFSVRKGQQDITCLSGTELGILLCEQALSRELAA